MEALVIMTSSSGFFSISGTVAPGAGYPTGMSRYGFSVFGRRRISARKPIGLGVCVSVASPAKCSAP